MQGFRRGGVIDESHGGPQIAPPVKSKRALGGKSHSGSKNTGAPGPVPAEGLEPRTKFQEQDWREKHKDTRPSPPPTSELRKGKRGGAGDHSPRADAAGFYRQLLAGLGPAQAAASDRGYYARQEGLSQHHGVSRTGNGHQGLSEMGNHVQGVFRTGSESQGGSKAGNHQQRVSRTGDESQGTPKLGNGEPVGKAGGEGDGVGWRGHISTDNVGYKLLRSAGWREGEGLGAQEQGITSPIPAWMQSGRRGIGAPAAGMQRPTDNVGKAAGQQKRVESEKGEAAPAKGEAKRVKRAKRIGAEGPPEPKEDLETKVKRVKQVWQAEVDAEAEAALSRYMRRAFDEPDRVTESNPILRRNRLSDRNPLL